MPLEVGDLLLQPLDALVQNGGFVLIVALICSISGMTTL
jgi:hypothetical protein